MNRIELGHVCIMGSTPTYTEKRPQNRADRLPQTAFSLGGFFKFFDRGHGD